MPGGYPPSLPTSGEPVDGGGQGRPPGDGGKPALRRAALARRAARSPAARRAAALAIAGHATALAGRLRARTVAAYVGVGDEPATLPALDALRAAGVRVLLPVVDGAALDWAPYAGADLLRAGARGLLEPATGRLGAGALREAGLVLAPALLVDRSGTRLGRGGGYYDRALAAGRPAHVHAVVFADEVVAELPREPHDAPVTGALTPDGAVFFVPRG